MDVARISGLFPLPSSPRGCGALTMAGDASVPFSFPEVWEEESSRDKGRLRSRSREHQTYNAGGLARDVAEDDDGGFLAAQRHHGAAVSSCGWPDVPPCPTRTPPLPCLPGGGDYTPDGGGAVGAAALSFTEKESEEQSPPETSHAEANEAVMVQLFAYPHEDPLWKQLLWCSCLRIHNEAVMVQLLRRLSRLV